MNRFRLLRSSWRVGMVLLAAAGMLWGLGTVARAKEAAAKPAPQKLSGADLYAINCNRCHSERYPTEWTKGQWKTVLTHMRVRANLPASQAKEILKYLQENAGN